jgi:hypothetical protein
MIEYNNLNIKLSNNLKTLKHKEDEITKLKNRIKELESKSKKSVISKKSHSANKNYKIDNLNTSK